MTVTRVESSKRRPEGPMLKSWNAPWWHFLCEVGQGPSGRKGVRVLYVPHDQPFTDTACEARSLRETRPTKA